MRAVERGPRNNLVLTFIACGFFTVSCAPAEYAIRTAKQAQSVLASSAVCEKASSSTTPQIQSGLKGHIYAVTDWVSRAQFTRSSEYIENGTLVDADLFLNRLFVPTAPASRGFQDANGQALQNDSGSPINEYFAIDLQSDIVLSAGQATGRYQFAVLSDSGATLAIDDGSGVYRTIVDNEGAHQTRMGCAVVPVEFRADRKVKMRLTYFHGRSEYVSLVLLWRPWNERGAVLTEPCTATGTTYFFDPRANPPVPARGYNEILRKGWTVLGTENFETTADLNRCS